jgi:hypothetical protein
MRTFFYNLTMQRKVVVSAKQGPSIKKNCRLYVLFILVRTTTISIQFIIKPVFWFWLFPCCCFAFISEAVTTKNSQFIYDLSMLYSGLGVKFMFSIQTKVHCKTFIAVFKKLDSLNYKNEFSQTVIKLPDCSLNGINIFYPAGISFPRCLFVLYLFKILIITKCNKIIEILYYSLYSVFLKLPFANRSSSAFKIQCCIQEKYGSTQVLSKKQYL